MSQHPVSIPHVSSFEIIFFFLFLSLSPSLSPLRPLAGTSLFFAFCLFTRVPSSREDPTTHGWTIRREIFIQPPTRSNSLRPQVHSVLLFETIIGRMIFTGVNEGHRRFATRHGSPSQPYRYHTDSSWFVLRFYCFLLFSLLFAETFIFKRSMRVTSSRGRSKEASWKRINLIIESNRSKKIFQKFNQRSNLPKIWN